MSGNATGDTKFPCKIKRRKTGTKIETMASKTIKVLCVMIVSILCFFYVQATTITIGEFYRNRAPSYIEKELNRSKIMARSVTDRVEFLHVIEHAFSSWVFDKQQFNVSLYKMFQEWKYCSLEKFKIPQAIFSKNDTNYGCTPDVQNLEKNVFYMHVIMNPDCVDNTLETQTIGKGEVDGQQSWIYNTNLMYSNRLIAHELGHNFGLLHAARDENEYGDFTCVMGMIEQKITLPYPTCFNAPHTYQLEWTAPYHITQNGSYVIEKNDRFMYRINDIYFFRVINEYGYLYAMQKDFSKGRDTLLLAILQPGVIKANVANFEIMFQNNILHVKNSTTPRKSSSYVRNILLFLASSGVLVTLFFLLWY